MTDLSQAREILDRLPYPGVTERGGANKYKFLANLEAIDQVVNPKRYEYERKRLQMWGRK